MNLRFVWTDGDNKDFSYFYDITEEYYNQIVGGKENRKSFVSHNLSSTIDIVLICYDEDTPIGCVGLRKYSDTDVEVKRLWVEPTYRKKHIALKLMELIEEKAKSIGYIRIILQTREIMESAVKLYEGLGYERIEKYPPYDTLQGAICMAKYI